MTFLDARSLKACRLVNKVLEEEARSTFMNRSELHLYKWQTSTNNNDNSRLARFASWRLHCDLIGTITTSYTSYLQDWGAGVTSLHISGLMPEWTRMVRGAIMEWCPNLQSLHIGSGLELSCPSEYVEMEEFCNVLDRTGAVQEFTELMNSTKLPNFLIFQPFSSGISCSVHTLRLQWDSPFYRTPACLPLFIFKVAESCSELMHVYLLDREPSLTTNSIDDSRFGVVKHLARHPHVTRNLRSFAWRMRTPRRTTTKTESATQPVRFVTANKDIPRIQFGSKLRLLCWDIMHVDRDVGVLLPGTLTTTVAYNLARVSIPKVVLDASRVTQLQRLQFVQYAAERRRWINTYLSPEPRLTINYEVMPKMCELKISVDACYSIHLNDIIDAIPNLHKLDIIQFLPNQFGLSEDERWTGRIRPSQPLVQHRSLRMLNLWIAVSKATIMGHVAMKFPCLEELWVGHPESRRINLDLSSGTFVSILECLKSLKRFKIYITKDLDIVQLLDHIASVQEKLTWVEIMYHLRFTHACIIQGQAEYTVRRRELHKKNQKSGTGSSCQVLISWWNPFFLGVHEKYGNLPEEEALRATYKSSVSGR
jgi:hypothetical protein